MNQKKNIFPNVNYNKKFLNIKVSDMETQVIFFDYGKISLDFLYQIGHKHIKEDKNNLEKWINKIILSLHKYSLIERIPQTFYLETDKNHHLFDKKLKDKNTYSQFFIKSDSNFSGIYVIIKKVNYHTQNSFLKDFKQEENNFNNQIYARYKEAITKFKI